MKKFRVSLSQLMHDNEVLVGECDVGVYVAKLWGGLIQHSARLIRYDSTKEENAKNSKHT